MTRAREGGDGGHGRTEVEATLRVSPEGGEELAAEVAGLEAVAGHPIRRRGPVALEDVYLDTPDDELGAAGLALRLRRAGGAPIVAVKGDERRLPGGGARRLEVEREWSRAALVEIGELLAGRGFEPPEGAWPEGADPTPEPRRRGADEGTSRQSPGGRGSPGREDPDPEAILRGLGFVVIQRRRTQRRRAAIGSPDGEGSVGVLVVDRVGYRVRSGRGPTAVHREVEVEGAGVGAEAVVADVARGLRRRFDGLRPWAHDKLVTGRALDRLSELGELRALLGPGDVLTERAYARVDALLRASGA